MKLIKIPSVFSLFVFRTCFTTCIGITWAFLPLLASTKMALSSSEIGAVVMINVLIAGLSTGADGVFKLTGSAKKY